MSHKILLGLNPEQKAAVLHNHDKDGALLILAGAGSGKTSVLTKRILYRIESGLPSSQILALTFTAKAAAEMSERVQHASPNSQALLCTFHSLALRIIKMKINGVENWRRLGFAKQPMPKENSDFEWQNMLVENGFKAGSLNREELFGVFKGQSPLGEGVAENPTLLGADKMLDGDKMQMENKTRDGKNSVSGKSVFSNGGLKARGSPPPLKNLQDEVLKTGNVVFEDLILLATCLMTDFLEVRRYISQIWTEILIDEYQDINPSQYKMARAVLSGSAAYGAGQNIFAVGDDDQAIYGFRGADIGNILRFQSDFPNCKIIKLEWNYRSTPAVLETANRIFADKPLVLRKKLRAAAMRNYALFKENRKPEIWVSQTAEEEIAKIVFEIKFLKEEYGMQNGDFALLSRYNRQCEYYRIALGEYGVDGVKIETIHASKGLQYPVVFYCGLAENLSPGELPEKRKERKKQLDEEKRLFYVGVTRAEAHLIFLYCKSRYFKGELKNFKISQFVKFAAEKPFSKGIKMPVAIFKIIAVVKIIGYMLTRIPLYFFQAVFRKRTVDEWLHNALLNWAQFCLRALRIDLSVKAQEKLARVDWSRPVFVIANHSSFADIPTVLVCAQRNLGFLAKKELSLIPVLSYWMRKIGCVFIDRKSKGVGKKLRDSMTAVSIEKPPQIVIFPEGTRSKNNEMGVWKSGAFRMAAEFKGTILPIILKGARDSWENLSDASAVHEVNAEVLECFDVAEWERENGREIDVKQELMKEIRKRYG